MTIRHHFEWTSQWMSWLCAPLGGSIITITVFRVQFQPALCVLVRSSFFQSNQNVFLFFIFILYLFIFISQGQTAIKKEALKQHMVFHLKRYKACPFWTVKCIEFWSVTHPCIFYTLYFWNIYNAANYFLLYVQYGFNSQSEKSQFEWRRKRSMGQVSQ